MFFGIDFEGKNWPAEERESEIDEFEEEGFCPSGLTLIG